MVVTAGALAGGTTAGRRDAKTREKRNVFVYWSLPTILTLWAITPEIRRLIDWQIGYSALPIVALVPLLALGVLIVPVLRSGFANTSGALRAVLILWSSGFAYALFISFISGNLISGAYDLAQFLLPMLFALALLSEPTRLGANYARIANTMLVLATLLSIYGIYQYASPPAWDVTWMINADIASIGSPEPFGFRIFSTLNSPGPFADFLTLALILNFPRVRLRSPLVVGAMLLCSMALALTFIRSGWLALAVGGLAYVVLSPRRFHLALPVAAATVVLVALVLNASTLFGNATVTTNIVDRVSTLGDVENDQSANDRKRETDVAINDAKNEPMGQGLGTVGTSAKLGSSAGTVTLDNGYLSRVLEMGFVGSAAYVAAIVAALGFTMARYRGALLAHDAERAVHLAASVGVQLALVGLDLSSDHHIGFEGIVFWVVVVVSLQMGRTDVAGGRADAAALGPALRARPV